MQSELKRRHAAARGTSSQLFEGFWMGGFESACQVNTRGVRIDMVAATQHDVHAREDYEMVRRAGIRVVRDGVRWPCVETKPGQFDWKSFVPMVRAAEKAGVQVIWNLLHYGWPADVDILSGDFVQRFVKFCREVARIVSSESGRVPVYVPVNEISFLAWGIGERGIIQPVQIGKAWEIKQQLVRAAIAAMETVWDVDKRARFVHADPMIHVMPPRDRPDLAGQALAQRDGQFEAWDMLSGKRDAELGGAPKYLDVVGVNFYHCNQFETPDVRLRWEDDPRDDRWVPFHRLLDEVWKRYERPVIVAETSHFGVGRGQWLSEVAHEVYIARMQGVPVEGLCVYPIIDRPDWEEPAHWHNSGLWDLRETAGGRLERSANEECMNSLRQSQELLAEIGVG